MSESHNFPNKERRQKCWAARDKYWDCLDQNDVDKDKNKDDINNPCKEFKKLYESECPPAWVTHFNRKYEFEKFKSKLANEGFDKLDSK